MDYLDSTIEKIGQDIRDLEAKLQETKVWKAWKKKYRHRANLTSSKQLGDILFNVLKHPCTSRTATGQPKTDQETLEWLGLDFTDDFIRMKKLQKVRGTYLQGIRREVCDGYLHPFFNLAGGGGVIEEEEDEKGGPRTYRSSSSMPNFQNMPIRIAEMGELVRRCFIPRDGHVIVEIDFSGIEVRIAYCYHKDPTMRNYLTDPTTDMHRDTAMELFHLKLHQVEKKGTRDVAKNKFVFPQFYGSYYVDCARNIWNECLKRKLCVLKKDGSKGPLVIDHLKKFGIMELGDLREDQVPRKGTFERRVKEIEDSFWNERFPVYTAWKKQWYKEYLRKGYFDMYTGFRCTGYYRRNQVINYPVQGPAFHCLLETTILAQDWINKKRMKTLILGEVHDSVLLDVPLKELQDVLNRLSHIMKVIIPKKWKWINIPLEVEIDVTPEGMSWHEKKQWVERNGVWTPAA